MLNIRTHTISGAEIRAKRKSGMTTEQITKELLNSPTEEVKPSQVAQLMKENKKLKEQLVDKDDEISCHCEQIEKLEEELNRYPEGAAGYTGEEFEELVNVMEDIENHPNYDEADQNDFQKGYDAGREEYQVDKEYLDEKEEEIDKLKAENEKLKNKTLDNPQRSFDAMCKVVVELQEQIKTLKEENEELKSLKQAEINEAVISDEGTAKLIMDIAKLIGEVESREKTIKELKKHFNIIIDLIKGCDTDEKLQKLKELNTLG